MKKKANKTKQQIPTTNPDYEVETILDHRLTSDLQFEFLLKWKNYPNSENSWENETALEGCKELIEEYKKEKRIIGFQVTGVYSLNGLVGYTAKDSVGNTIQITSPFDKTKYATHILEYLETLIAFRSKKKTI